MSSITVRFFILWMMAFFSLSASAQSNLGLNPGDTEVQIPVTHIVLEGFTALHDYPIDLSDLRQRIEKERAKYPSLMSVDQLHQVADTLTLYLRGIGYVFHTVYLPPQTVSDGTVKLLMQEGRLTAVNVINQTDWSSERFRRVFEPLLGSMLYGPEVEERVQALKAQTGTNVFAFYSRAERAGEARLNLRVEPADKRQFMLKADNFGSAVSGQYRVLAQYTENQLTGRFDQLSVALLRSLDDVDNTYGSVRYSLPSPSLNYIWDISASNNQFELGDRFAALGLKGDATVLRTGLTRVLGYQMSGRQQVRLGAYHKRNNLDSDLVQEREQREQSQALSASWSKSQQWPTSGVLLSTHLGLNHGQFELGEGDSESFNKLEASALWLRGTSGPSRWRGVLQVSARGQYSDVALPSVEGFSLTGAYGVRGFAPGRMNADRALLLSAEWRWPVLLQRQAENWLSLQPLLFADAATGSKPGRDDIEGQAQVPSQGTFSGAGAGLRFNLGRRVSGQLTAAWPIDGEINNTKVVGNEQWLFEVRWH